MRFLPSALLATGVALAGLAIAVPARAEPSAWAQVSGGVLAWRQGLSPQRLPLAYTTSATTTFDFGVGTTPDAPVIFGGFARVQPVWNSGVDLALLGRVATHGFQAANWGVAVDLGGYLRFWGTQSQGATFGVSLGAPLGFTLSLQAMAGTNDAVGFGAVAGIDFLRLTIYRQTLLKSWENRSPAWTRSAASSGLWFF